MKSYLLSVVVQSISSKNHYNRSKEIGSKVTWPVFIRVWAMIDAMGKKKEREITLRTKLFLKWNKCLSSELGAKPLIKKDLILSQMKLVFELGLDFFGLGLHPKWHSKCQL